MKALLLLLAFFLVQCADDAPDKRPPTVHIPPDAPNEESWNTTLILTDSNWTKAKMQVGHVRKYDSRMETLMSGGVYIEFYDRAGNIGTTLIADSARIDDRTRDMSAFGAVHVVNAGNQTTVDTEKLFYDSQRHRFHSDSWVKVVDGGRGLRIEGVGFTSTESLDSTTVYNVSGTLRQ